MNAQKTNSALRFVFAVAALALAAPLHVQSTTHLFSAAETPTVASENDPQSVEVGVRFYATDDGVIDAIRFYCGNSGGGQFRIRLGEADGAVFGQGNVSEGLPFRVPSWGDR